MDPTVSGPSENRSTASESSSTELGTKDKSVRLVWAAARGAQDEVKQLLQEGNSLVVFGDIPPGKCVKSVHRQDNFFQSCECNRTALQAAAEGGHEKVVQMLLDNGAEVNVSPARNRGRTALQAAAERGHEKVVQMLLDNGAQVNAAPAYYLGRTALQAAAGGGHEKVVQMLLDKGAEVNASPAEYGRTALQAAAEGRHEKVVQMLLDNGAEVNAVPAHIYGRTALQAAAGGGHEKVVQMLLDNGAKVNAVPAGFAGRTALQAAAGGGHEKVVQMLLDNGAEVNAEPAKMNGRTALQAAAGRGHEKVVQMLLDKGAEVNAEPARNDGRTALQAAAEGGHEKVVQTLLDNGADVSLPHIGSTVLHDAVEAGNISIIKLLMDKRNNLDPALKDKVGRNVLHVICQHEQNDLLRFFLGIGKPDCNTRDFTGSTPLHVAVRSGHLSTVELLISKGAELEIKDTSGKTPLKLALEKSQSSILQLLLKKGSLTDDLKIDNLGSLRKLCGSVSDNEGSMVIICDDPSNGRSVEGCTTKSIGDRSDWDHRYWSSPSILFEVPSLQSSQDVPHRRSPFANPEQYLPNIDHRGARGSGSGVEWAWAILPNKGNERAGFVATGEILPLNNQEILSLRPAEVVLVGYSWFCGPFGSLEGAESISSDDRASITPFKPSTQMVDMSWIMRQPQGASNLRSVHYRAGFDLQYLAIPQHGVDFVQLFLQEIHRKWVELLEKAKLHLETIRDEQLTKAGKEPKIIQCLLMDSREWYKLRTEWQKHHATAKKLLRAFTSNDVLYTELIPSGGEEPDVVDVEKLEAIKLLSEKIQSFEEECGKALSALDRETKELIELEFNLVSIFEARRSISMAELSIKMTKQSNEMAASMKLLSWITFIFLPLMFVTGLFGMNIDILGNNPPWQWYPIVTIPFCGMVLVIWCLCKYLAVTEYLDNHIGKHLKRLFGKDTASGAPISENTQQTSGASGSVSSPSAMNLLNRFRRRKGRRNENDLGV